MLMLVMVQAASEPAPVPLVERPLSPATASLDDLREAVDAGEEITFAIKANVAAAGYVFLRDGTLTISKSSLKLRLDFGTFVSNTNVSPGKIVSFSHRDSRLHLRVREMQMTRKLEMREARQDYNLYHPSAMTRGVAPDGRVTTLYYSGGGNIVCERCDDLLDKVHGLLAHIRTAGSNNT